MEKLFLDIKNNDLDTWDSVHERYDELFKGYPEEKYMHAIAVLKDVFGIELTDKNVLREQLFRYGLIHDLITRRVFESREKDYKNHFKLLNFDSPEEMEAVMGKVDDNGFIISKREENKEVHSLIEKLIK